MKKIEAIGRIVNTNKVAYNTAHGSSLHCSRHDYVYFCSTAEDGHIACISSVDSFANFELSQEGWEVSDKEYDKLEDFKFPDEMLKITVDQALQLLLMEKKIIGEYQCIYKGVTTGIFASDDQQQLHGVLPNEDAPFIVGTDFCKATDFRVRSSLLKKHGLIS